MSPDACIGDAVAAALAVHHRRRPLVVGLCGPQGSGKSTIAARLADRFDKTAVLSLDDLYLSRAERNKLAQEVHPLFRTRGVPGTHDLSLGLDVLRALDEGRTVALPRFDKALDERSPKECWPVQDSNCEMLILEGWCVGARAQSELSLVKPCNLLEQTEDEEGVWRRAVNDALVNYAVLFDRIDFLVLLSPPSFDVVETWRLEQEHALRAKRGDLFGVMDDEGVRRFIAHFERITNHTQEDQSMNVNLILEIDADRQIVSASKCVNSLIYSSRTGS